MSKPKLDLTTVIIMVLSRLRYRLVTVFGPPLENVTVFGPTLRTVTQALQSVT
jgi:hypothetical protein